MNEDYGFKTPDEELQLLSLSPDEFSQGIARLIEFVLENKTEKKVTTLGGAGNGSGGVAPADQYSSGTYE